MIFALFVVVFFVMMVVSELSNQRKNQAQTATADHSADPHQLNFTHQHQNQPHFPPNYYPPQGPIFSPDKRHLWDAQNQRWIANDGGMGIGLVIGLVVGIGAMALLYFA